MRSRFVPTLPGLAVLLGVAALALAVQPVQAQYHQHPGQLPPGYCPPAPGYLPVPAKPPAQAAPQPQQQPSQQQQQPGQQQAQQPQQDAPQDTQGQADSSFAPEASAATGGETVAMAAPSMIGDQLAGSSMRRTIRLVNGATVTAILPVQVRGAFKIADNESPQPRDRVFVNFNYFNNVNDSLNPVGLARVDVYRETFGFEKTMLDGMASIGVRLPVLQVQGDGSLDSDDFGDLSVVLKYAFINNCCTGNVVSGGLVVTAPTGGTSSFAALVGGDDIHSTLLQPWAGFVYNGCGWFVQGFTSVAIPTDNREATLYFNDIALGYWLYVAPDCRFRSTNAFAEKGGGGCWSDPTMNAFSGNGCAPYCCGHSFISALIPTIEAHSTTPLDHRSLNQTDLIVVDDALILTAGMHIRLMDRANLLVGAAAPVVGPRPFAVEGVLQFNWNF